MKKKGSVFIPFLVLLTTVALGISYYFLYMEERKGTLLTLGELHTNSLSLVQEAEKDLLSLDNMAKYAVYNALVTLSGKERILSENVGTEIFNEFKDLFEKEMNVSLSKMDRLGLDYRYIYHFDNDITIEGLSQGEIKKDHKSVVYRVRPSFKVKVDFDFSIFNRLYEKYSLLEHCLSSSEFFDTYLVTCIEKKVSEQEVYLSYEVVTKDFGLVQPVIRFKIPQAGNLFT